MTADAAMYGIAVAAARVLWLLASAPTLRDGFASVCLPYNVAVITASAFVVALL